MATLPEFEEFLKSVGERVLDEFQYRGFTIREWANKIMNGEYKPVKYAEAVKIFNDPYTEKMFTTCSACCGKISPNDVFCKHCGATIIKR